jgi:hypothetical protein
MVLLLEDIDETEVSMVRSIFLCLFDHTAQIEGGHKEKLWRRIVMELSKSYSSTEGPL